MEIKKSNLYFALTILLILAGGLIMLRNGSSDSTGNAIIDNSNEEAQKIVLSIKNYNYYPNTLKVKEGIPVSISLDESVYGCFRDFTIREFGIHEYLKTPQDTIEFTPTKKGTYTFACSMGMGTGTLVVE